ncbi:GNAT family N-acetyltransferase [Massilia arenosa]|uniref:GNAT family N-acetyltransferase n=1 Tax=Zemynaea arenosa TaxID=2561931 RepID=A0A4Y9SJU8_9BURK|nr:GNAT family N-acetyltransferase [Massilia arenosa]TFW26570.1 GNAT family N-acetyltransferase [Massilia arenosa]
MTACLRLEPAQPQYRDAMAALFRDVCRGGDALPFTEDTSDELFDAMWLAPGIQSFVALDGGEVAGMYKLNANFPGRASHVSSATFLVSPNLQGRGIGGAMLRDALAKATAQGFRSMQFNFVVSTNAPAVALYQKHGFAIAGTLPGAFHHTELGYVDAYVMTRAL